MKTKSISASTFPEYLKREYPEDPPWKGFFKLWLDAKGYEYGTSDEHIVDGAGDGGIDAIAYPPYGESTLRIIVIQSKYFRNAVPDRMLNKFLQAVKIFRDGNSQQFGEWLSKVKRVSVRNKYRKLWLARKRIDFVLVTSGAISKKTKEVTRKLGIQVEDKRKVKALFLDMLRGKTPRPDRIILTKIGETLSSQTKDTDNRLYVFTALIDDLARAYQMHENALFAGNVRYALRNGTSQDVKNGIKDTLEGSPGKFVYFHNGITLVCKRMQVKGNRIHLLSPSIVNGAQTVSCVGGLARRISQKATVLVKVIEVRADGGFEEFETDVAMSSNTQNKVSISDLSVIDPGLVSLERYFRVRGSFLIRKKGDMPNGNVTFRIDKDRLLQLFACLDKACGPASTKDKQNLYKFHADRLFNTYAETIQRKKNAYFMASLDRFFRSCLNEFKLQGKRGKRKKRRLSLSYFTIFTVMVRLVEDHKVWTKMRSAFDADGILDNEYSITLNGDVKKIASAVLALARKDPDRNDTAFFKNRDKVAKMVNTLRKRFRKKLAIFDV